DGRARCRRRPRQVPVPLPPATVVVRTGHPTRASERARAARGGGPRHHLPPDRAGRLGRRAPGLRRRGTMGPRGQVIEWADCSGSCPGHPLLLSASPGGGRGCGSRPALSEDSPYPTDRVWPGGSHPGHTGHYERALGHTATRIPTPAESPPLPWVQLRRLLLDGMMPAAARTYWLTTACRIRRQDQSLVIERNLGDKVHIPITDVRDIVAGAPVDLNSSVVALLNQHRVSIHFLSHYGDYAGSLLT